MKKREKEKYFIFIPKGVFPGMLPSKPDKGIDQEIFKLSFEND